MKKCILALLLTLAIAFSLTACALKPAEPVPEPVAFETEAAAPEPAPEPELEPEPVPLPVLRNDLVGISLPEEDKRRWKQEGEMMQRMLENANYEVDLRFAGNDPSVQAAQLEDMLARGTKVLIIAAIDGDALNTVLDRAKDAGCAVVAYDRTIGSDAVSCYATFDICYVGIAQACFIVNQLDLDNAGDRVFNIELIGGSPDAYDPFYRGGMNVLEPYIYKGALRVLSGQFELEDIATENLSSEKAQERFENLLTTYYADNQLDAVWCEYDSTAQGVAAALATSYANEEYPIITGWGCDIANVYNILEGKQDMSVFMDTRNLASIAVEMADALMNGAEPPAQFTYIDGARRYPAFYVNPTVCTRDNILELLIDSGYYTAEELGVETEN